MNNWFSESSSREKDLSPYFHDNFNAGELSCSYENGEKLSISECNSNNLNEVSNNGEQDGDENNHSPEKYKCADIGDWNLAQKLLSQGHFYLDRDNDGEACEVLAD